MRQSINSMRESREGRALDIELALRQFISPRQKEIYQRFFKTGKGEYGEGDKFLGVVNPRVRLVVKESWRGTSAEDVVELVHSAWHEVRLCGLLILVAQFEQAYKKKDAEATRRLAQLYLSLHPYINNWDLVDLTVYKVIGRYELLTQDYSVMDEWVLPNHSLWQRRMAMVATWMHARRSYYEKLLWRAEVLLTSRHDLLHKATGWMLREMYKHDERGREMLEQFLEAHVKELPSVMLSYAMEKMSEQERQYWRHRRAEK